MSIFTAKALECIHAAGITHRAVTPSNIVWNPDSGQLKLIDFSIATDNPTQKDPPVIHKEQLHTLPYFSPEMTGRMNRNTNYLTDIYSFGVTLYELLTGTLPFTGKDALEIIHNQIAGIPILPHKLKHHIPVQVSRIVEKLLRKNAEERYQSVFGIIEDMELCLTQLKEKDSIKPFRLGQKDFPSILQISQKLYGRENEIKALTEAYVRASSGALQLLLVTGYSGVGKTAIVHEIHKPVTNIMGYFIEGKFDQYQRDIPYYAWRDAFTRLVNYWLMESDTQVGTWKNKILETDGINPKVLAAVIPNLEFIIGPQPEIPELGGTEAQNRFNFEFRNFINSITSDEHPLVIFLDDVQWIDAASLSLLRHIFMSTEITHLLVICAYRDNEVDALHPLSIFIDELEKEVSNIDKLTLDNLSQCHINAFVADTMKCSLPVAEPFSQLITSKTDGNAFFTHQMIQSMEKERMLTSNLDNHCWEWDIEELKKSVNITIDLRIWIDT